MAETREEDVKETTIRILFDYSLLFIVLFYWDSD